MNPIKVRGFDVNVKSKNVNGKLLFEQIHDFFQSKLEKLPFAGHLTDHLLFSLTRSTTEFFNELLEQQQISRFTIICDGRNNTPQFLAKKGFATITVRYTQKNCLNNTELTYTMVRR